MTSVTVAIPTRGRPRYLEATLASIAPQVAAVQADVLVVLDGPDPASNTAAQQHGARTVILPTPEGANAARNAALANTDADVVIFTDDDVEAPAGWLGAFLTGIAENPDHGALGGPISARLEGGPPHCGSEPAPITTLDHGSTDHDVEYVWSANMAIRRSAVAEVGDFDAAIHGRGEEEEWQDRLRAAGGRVRYLAHAGLVHRRTGADAKLPRLAAADYHLGRSARINDVRKGSAPTLTTELRDLAGALWHTLARRCGYGIVFAAHAVGRIQETLDPSPLPAAPGEFTSGYSGYVAGTRALTTARFTDRLADLRSAPTRHALTRDAIRWGTPKRVLVLALERDDVPNVLDAALDELTSSSHHVTVARATAGDGGRFENFNRLLAAHQSELEAADWLIAIDDDVALPGGFLDAFLFLAGRHHLQLAQPAHRRLSHAAWPVTRRRPGAVLRETGFVEIGPLVAFRHDTFAALLPFPELRVGWGVDAHWAAIASQHDWRTGVVDATAISHALRPVAASYDQSAALAESRAFLSTHAHITPAQADRTLHTHRRW